MHAWADCCPIMHAGKDTQLCGPCNTAADCGPLGSHIILPEQLGGLDKGHVLYAHYPTVCHQRSCVPVQVPAKDGFCRGLHAAHEAAEQSRLAAAAHKQQQAAQAGFSLSKLAQRLTGHLTTQQATAKPQPARRQLQDNNDAPRRFSFAPAPGPSSHYERRGGEAAAQQPSAEAATASTQQGQQQASLVGGSISNQNVAYDRFGNPYVKLQPTTPLQSAASSQQAQGSYIDSGSSTSPPPQVQQQQAPQRQAAPVSSGAVTNPNNQTTGQQQQGAQGVWPVQEHIGCRTVLLQILVD